MRRSHCAADDTAGNSTRGSPPNTDSPHLRRRALVGSQAALRTAATYETAGIRRAFVGGASRGSHCRNIRDRRHVHRLAFVGCASRVRTAATYEIARHVHRPAFVGCASRGSHCRNIRDPGTFSLRWLCQSRFALRDVRYRPPTVRWLCQSRFALPRHTSGPHGTTTVREWAFDTGRGELSPTFQRQT